MSYSIPLAPGTLRGTYEHFKKKSKFHLKSTSRSSSVMGERDLKNLLVVSVESGQKFHRNVIFIAFPLL